MGPTQIDTLPLAWEIWVHKNHLLRPHITNPKKTREGAKAWNINYFTIRKEKKKKWQHIFISFHPTPMDPTNNSYFNPI